MADEPTPRNDAPPWDAKRNRPTKGAWRRILGWALVLGLLAVILYGLRPKPVEVEMAEVKTGSLAVHVSEEGKTRIRNRYVVAAPVAGHMKRVPLKPGDEVKAGETLLTTVEPAISPLLDPRAKAQAEARVEQMQATLKQAEQTLEVARTSERFARTNWDRIQAIKDQGSISANERDLAEREATVRAGEVRAAEFAQRVAQFELEQARASLLQISEPGKGTAIEIRSPVSGRVLKVMQERESVVTAGLPVLEVGDPADIEIEAEILSRDAVAMKPGDKMSVEQWGGDKPLDARVRRIEPAAFTKISALGVEEQRVIVLADLINPPPEATRLGDRFRIEARVEVWHGDDLILIPAGALFREGNLWKTFVFENGKAVKRELRIGRTDGRQSQVLGGIAPGVTVLVHPPDSVKDGTEVVRRQEG